MGDEERPFRDQRRWVYASAKLENNYFGFGTDNDIEHTPGYPVVKHTTFGRIAPPSDPSAGQEAWVSRDAIVTLMRRTAPRGGSALSSRSYS